MFALDVMELVEDLPHFSPELIHRGRLLAEESMRGAEQEMNQLTAIFNSALYRGRNTNE